MNALNKVVIEYFRLFHALRIIIACIIAFIIDIIFDLPYGTWAPITIIVVMSAKYSGEVSDKASQRILGTTLGAVLGLSIYLLPADSTVLHYGVLLLALSVSLYFTLGKYAYSAILTSVTLVLVAGSGPGDLHIALWRTTNVLWGGILAIIASNYLFPAKASEHFKILCGEYLKLFHQYYSEHNALVNSDDAYREIKLVKLQQVLNKITALGASIEHELPERTASAKQTINSCVRMFNLLDNIVHTQWRHQYSQQKIQELRELSTAKEQLSILSQQLGQQVLQDNNQVVVIDKPQLAILAIYPTLEQQNDTRTDMSYYGYLWLNRELARQLSELSTSLFEFNH